MRISQIFLVLGLALAANATRARAAEPTMSYAGRIVSANGKPMSGTYDLEVRFFGSVGDADQLGSTVLVPEVPFVDGLFQVPLTFSGAELNAVFGDYSTPVYVEISTGGKVYPRQRFLATPYALRVPIDNKTLRYDENGKLAVGPAGSPSANQFLTKDGSGSFVWATPEPRSVTADPTGLAAADEGKVWFNSTSNQLKYWDGSAAVTLGGGGGGGTLTSISGQTGAAQTLSFGTAGNSPAWTHAANDHTLNIPMANAGASVTAGLLSNADYVAFGNKQANLGYTPINKAGDVMTGTFGLASLASDPAGLVVADKGKVWFNSTTGEIKYWNGTAPVALGAAGSGLGNLSGETGSAQTLSLGAAGTAPAWTHATNDHKLDLPLASGAGVTAGLISKADYDAFNGKQAALGFTPLNKGGDTFAGNMDGGGFNVTNLGDVALGASKTLMIGAYAADPSGLGALDAGKLWWNSTSGKVKYWDGGAARVIGTDTVTSSEIANGTIVDADVNASAAIATSKLSGAVTSIAGHGLGSLATLNAVGSSEVTNGSLVDADVNASAAIATSKLSGAVTSISGHGLGSLATLSAVGSSEVTNGSLVDADINASAAIATSKISGAVTSISGHGLGSLATLSTVGSSEVTNGSLVDADISASAAIDPTKIAGGTGITSTEFGYLDGVSAGIQGQLDAHTTALAGKIAATGGVMTGTFGLASLASDPAGLVVGDKGKVWYNSTSGEVKYWNGSAPIALGAAGSGLGNLSGETGSTQTLSVGSAGTAPAWTHAANDHKIDIPLASAAGVTAGLISKADYDAFNGKQAALGFTPLNKGGDTFAGNMDGGGFNVTNLGDVALGASKTLMIGAYAADPSGLGALDAGKLWWNSTSGKVKYWDGGAARVIGTDTVTSAEITNGTIVDADVNASAAIATSKLSGAVTSISGHGLGSLATLNAVGSSEVTNGSLVDADVNASAAIATSKLSGAVTSISGHGLGSLATLNAVGSSEVTNGSLVDADVNASAAIATSKLSGAVTSISGHGLGSLATLNAVGSSEVTNDSLVDADINASAAIDPTKIAGGTGITGTEFGYLDGVTSSIQTQLNGKISATGGVMSGTFGLASLASDPAGLVTGDKGKVWYNSTSGEVKYWNGSAPIALGAAGSGLGNLSGETGSTQTLSVGSSGTAPAWTHSANDHKIDIPLAAGAGVTAGLISKTEYDAFNGKQAALGFTPLNKGGDTFAGHMAAAGYNVTGLGNVELGSNKTLLIGAYAADPSGLGALDAGRVWWNSTSGKVKYWDGGAARVIGTDTVTSSEIANGTIVDADVNASAAIATSKLSGAVTSIAGHGLGSLATLNAVGSSEVTNGSLVDADVNASAAIATSKLSGAVTSISGHGLGSLATLNAVGSSEVTNGSLVDADVNASAAIATSKLSGAVTSITGHGLGSLATLNAVGSTEITNGSIADTDISGSAAINPAKIDGGTGITNTEFSYLNGVTSSIQTQLDAKLDASHTHDALTGPAGSPADAVKVIASGNVGIGSTNPAVKLDVNGTVRGTEFQLNGATRLMNAGATVGDFAAVPANGNYVWDALADDLILKSYGKNILFSNEMNGNSRLRINVNGNVGIGTTSPSQKFQVDNSTGGTYAINGRSLPTTAADSTVYDAAAAFYARKTVNTGVTDSGYSMGVHSEGYLVGAGNVSATYGGRFDAGLYSGSTGNSTDAYAVRARVLDQGTGAITTGYGVYVDDVEATTGYGIYQAAANDRNYFGGKIGIGSLNPGYELDVAGTIRATNVISTSGWDLSNATLTNTSKIGIGTTSATYPLDVYQNAPTADQVLFRIGTSDDASRFVVDEDGDVYADGTIWAGGGAGTLMASVVRSNSDLQIDIDGNNNVTTDYLAFTHNGGTAELMRIQENGFVGIGTTNPAGHLDVYAAAGPELYLHNSTTGGTSTDGSLISAVNSDLWLYNRENANVLFGTNNAEKMRLTSQGRLGIGETSPGSALAVSGGATVGAAYDQSAAPTNGLIVEGNVGIGTTAPSSKLDVAGGTLPADGSQNAINATAAISSPTAAAYAAKLNVTTTGSASNRDVHAANFQLGAGLTGANRTSGLQVINNNAGTGGSIGWGDVGNYGVLTRVEASTTGHNAGLHGLANNGDYNYGVVGTSGAAKAGARNIGVWGQARNTAGNQVGGYFSLTDVGAASPTSNSAALVADNGTETSPIFLAMDNGSPVVTIADGGAVGIGSASPGYLVDVAKDQNNTTGLRVKNKVALGNTSASSRMIVESQDSSGYIGAFPSDYGGFSPWQDRMVVAAGTDSAGLALTAASAGQDIRMRTAAGDAVLVEAGGNVGIGTTDATAKLHVGGTAGVDGIKFPDGTLQTTSATSGDVPNLRFSRTTVAYNASDATKDSTCSTDFGAAYVAATGQDVLLHWGPRYNLIVAPVFNVRGSSQTYQINTGAVIATTTNATKPVMCIRAGAYMRSSYTTAAYNASAGTKDSACTTDFGSGYGAATVGELAAYNNGYVVTDSFAAEVFPFNLRDDTTYTWMIGPTYVRNASTTSTKPVYCVRIN